MREFIGSSENGALAMPRKRSERREKVVDVLHGGKKVPQALLRQHMAALARNFEARYQPKNALQQQASKYLAEIKKASAKPMPEGADVTRAMNGLREMSQRLANRKLAMPIVPVQTPTLSGTYSLVITPPYDYALSSVTAEIGNPTLSSSTDKISGQMSCSVATDFKAVSDGLVFCAIGIYFFPVFPSGNLRASVNPSFVFSVWASSLDSPTMVLPADTFAQCTFGITAYKGSTADGQNSVEVDLWEAPIAGDLAFDFGTMTHSLAAQLDVDGNHSYIISLACTISACAAGWPGSLAGGTLNTALPSITLEVEEGLPLQNA